MAYTYNIWKPEEETLLKRLCEEGNLNYVQMAKAYFPGRTGASLQGHAKRVLYVNSNYRYRKHWHNERFFEELNPLNCYVAGWVSSDGCVGKHTGSEAYYLRWTLQESDKHVLESIKQWMSYTGDIRTDVRKAGWRHVTLSLNGIQQIKNDLARHFGIVQRKAHRLPPPNLTEFSHKMAYLLGVLDGDGCVHVVKSTGLITIKIASCAKDLLRWILEFIQSLGLPTIRDKSLRVATLKQANTYEVAISGAKAIHFIELARQQGLPILDRKWNTPLLNAAISAYKTRFPAHFGLPVATPIPLSSQIISTPV